MDAFASARKTVSDKVTEGQRATLGKSIVDKGFDPQAQRDITKASSANTSVFKAAPPSKYMNLCNIQFHKGAEHKCGEFIIYAGKGYGSGYLYNGKLTKA